MHSPITPLAVLLLLSALLAACNVSGSRTAADSADTTELATLPAGRLSYYPPGEFLKGGHSVTPAPIIVSFDHGLAIMKRQVSQAEYAACVSEGACKELDRTQRGAASPALPAVGISWRDATAYAAWLSKATGHHYRLPTYAEWVYAAGPAYKEDVLLQVFDSADPAQRWLAEYELESRRKASVDAALRPFGGFGENPAGLLDMSGNVWDWTDTCHTRQHTDLAGEANVAAGQNCGLRVVAGLHRSYIADFIRDPKGGACSVGVPPSNLGLRLVRDPAPPAMSHALLSGKTHAG